MKRLTIVTSLILAPLIPSPAAAFKPAPPPKVMRFADKNTKTKPTLVITNKGWRPKSFVLRAGGERYRWANTPSLPATVRVAGLVNRVILFGGYGDGCSDLGKIAIYTLRGQLKASLDLKKHIPDLEKNSRAYTRICCPCRWLHKISLSLDHQLLEVDVCNKHRVRIELPSGKLKTVK